jgi:hypothetical protein
MDVRNTQKTDSAQTKGGKIQSLVLLTSIFLLNDFLFFYVKSYKGWLLVDYSTRLLAILIITYLIKTKECLFSDFGLVKIQLKPFALWAVLLSITGVLIDQIGWEFFEKVLPKVWALPFPKIENPFVKAFDVTVGIALVSVTEESIFRGYYFSVLRDRVKSPVLIVTISSVIFGLIHWSCGLHAIIATALWAVLPMVSVLRTRSILPAMVAHFATDFFDFVQ